MREFLTTGQAAKLCSVTPDAVLKWIKAGKIKAHRTPGGHFRIHRKNIEPMMGLEGTALPGRKIPAIPFQYCWEFAAKNGEILPKCRECIVYKSRARRCYEMSGLPLGSGHARLFCDESCERCEYYQLVCLQRLNVLVVTGDDSIQTELEQSTGDLEYNLRFAKDEYQCSRSIEKFRADFVVLDCSLGEERMKRLAGDIAADLRIPFTKIITVAASRKMPKKCDMEVFASIRKPLKKKVLDKLLSQLSKDNEIREETMV